MQPIPTQLSLKQENFSEFFCEFLKFNLDLEYFEKKDDSHSSDICEIRDSEKHG